MSSLAGAAAALGQELTQPGVAQSVVLTRLAGRTRASMPAGESVAAFAAHRPTLAVFLSAARPDELAAELLAPGSGYRPETPAAIVVRATWPDERVIRTTVGDLAGDLRATGATMTVLVLVGDALAEGPAARRSHLYSPGYSTAYRLRSRPGSTAGRPSARRAVTASRPHEPPLAPEVARAKGLRTGWTTGTCASAAAKAAVIGLLEGHPPAEVEVGLPGGPRVRFAVTDAEPGRTRAGPPSSRTPATTPTSPTAPTSP